MQHLIQQKKIKKIQTTHLSYFVDKSYFDDDGLKNYLASQQHFTTATNSNRILVWKSKGLSEESIKPSATSNNGSAPKLIFLYNAEIVVKLEERFLMQNITSFRHRNVTN